MFNSCFFIAASDSHEFTNISKISEVPKSPYLVTLKKTLNGIKKSNLKETVLSVDKNSVGIYLRPELPSLGPESFCNDTNGNLYICDNVNKRILLFDQNGNSTGSVDLDFTPNDLAVDDSGNIYIYEDAQGKLCQYNKNGSLNKTIVLELKNVRCRGSIHIVSNSIYMTSNDQEDLLIGKIEGGVLNTPGTLDSLQPISKGIFGESGKRYLINIHRKESAEIDVFSSGSSDKAIKASILMDGIVSANFLGEDVSGNFYIQTESIINSGAGIAISVIKCDSQGKVLNVLTLPAATYEIRTAKLLSLNKHGKIFQFAPSNTASAINVFSSSTSDEGKR
jgi:hypothetical protein